MIFDTRHQDILRILHKYNNFFGVRLSSFNLAVIYAHIEIECNFRITTESLNYNKTRFVQIFGRKYPEVYGYLRSKNKKANEYQIANIIYFGRKGNVNYDDGYRFRGRGFIQLTGRDNYASIRNIIKSKMEVDINILDYPQLLEQDLGINILVILAFWSRENLNNIMHFRDSQKIVNPHLPKNIRRKQFDIFRKYLTYFKENNNE
jgi:predicted chitinase